jgi:hypothetical protein
LEILVPGADASDKNLTAFVDFTPPVPDEKSVAEATASKKKGVIPLRMA